MDLPFANFVRVQTSTQPSAPALLPAPNRGRHTDRPEEERHTGQREDT